MINYFVQHFVFCIIVWVQTSEIIKVSHFKNDFTDFLCRYLYKKLYYIFLLNEQYERQCYSRVPLINYSYNTGKTDKTLWRASCIHVHLIKKFMDHFKGFLITNY